MRFVILAGACALLSACPEPTTAGTPQIPVNPKAPGMIDMIGSRSNKRPPRSTTKARVHVMKSGEELTGSNATGRPGDLIVENDEVVFVIDQLGVGFGFAQSGGNIIDAADAKDRRDELGQMFTYFGSFPRQAVYSKLDFEEKNGKAIIVAKGVELHEKKLVIETRYTLAPGDRAMLIETSLANEGDHVVKLGLGDAFQWGDTEKLIPGKPFGWGGKSVTPYIGGVGRFTSYAITSTEGEMPALSGGSWSDTNQQSDVPIPPKGSAQYARVFAIGERPDSASLVAELVRASDGGELGEIDVQLVDGKGAALEAPAGAKISLAASKDGAEALAIVARGGKIVGDVPPGKWFASYASSAGRRGVGAPLEIDVRKDQASAAKITVTEAGAIEVGCTEGGARVPCKVAVEGIDGTPNPDFGIGHIAAAARQYLFAATANASAALGPGRYRLTATRGVEYAAVTKEVTIAGNSKFEFELKRVLDTKGWIGADFHQHTLVGGDAPVARVDRVKANACEGVELAVASEHNVISPLQPAVSELSLKSFVVEITGEEITTDADEHPFGHVNAFPLALSASEPRGGAIMPFGLTFKEVFAKARALPGKRLIQVNHPRSGDNGYFDLTGFDPKTGVGTRAGYDASFDSIEVWNSRSVEQRKKVLDDYLALLRTRHPVTAVGNTDTHGVVGQEPGSPRTWVKVKDDAHLDAWDDARSDDLVDAIKLRREAVVSNGPFLSIDGGVGGVIKAKGGKVDVKVHVQAAPFVELQTISLMLASGKSPAAQPLTMKPNAAGALEADVTFSLTLSADDAFVVIASGTKPLRPMISGKDEEIAPWAMTSATWIDVDGDGKSLGR